MTCGFGQLDLSLRRRLVALGVRVEDVEEKFIRGSGPGGQKINKTSSTVCLRHVPTGIEVRVQRERSQSANRALAWAGLCSKLEARHRAEINSVIDARERERRRKRQKNRAQKIAMIDIKHRRARHKASRGRVELE
ncbi:MAG: peptide chain release factor-like protein [Verrucomicrobiota bacterium]|nr:peptide chain release factor-like protein [Verrucomicrobiota bacterium]